MGEIRERLRRLDVRAGVIGRPMMPRGRVRFYLTTGLIFLVAGALLWLGGITSVGGPLIGVGFANFLGACVFHRRARPFSLRGRL
jgi:hypothetical protein